MNDDYLEKLCKLEELPVNNILKIAECLYSKENKINKQDFFSEKWFICSCSDRDLSLICEECSKICHSNHKNKIEIPRSKLTMPICKCGKSRHRIPEALEENYKVNYEEFQGNCFISELSSNTLNKGYYKANNHIICHYCWDKCYNNNQDAFILIENSYLGISMYSCKCEFHKEKNFLSFSTEQEYKFIQKNMENYICLYNLNIFKKIPLFNNSFFKNNNDKFELICADDKNLIKMYSRFSLQNLMICFQKFDELRNQKYYYLKNYFDKLDINIFFQSLRDKNFIGKDVNYLYFQALLILIMFNTYVKSQYVKNNNLFGIDAILNMNPFQRNFFLLESKKFRNYTSEMKKGGLSEKYKEDKSVNMNEDEFSNLVDNFTDSILDFSENFIKLIGTHIIQVENILDDFFQWINKIFKFLIKYNLISLHKKIRFLEIMLDAFTLCTGNLKDLNNSSYYLLRTSLYCFLYKNDECVVKIIREKNIKKNKIAIKDLSFMCSYESDILIKIFINCIDKFERLDNIKSLKFDYSIKIIFDILLSKDDIYNKSLRNLFILDGNSLQQFLNPKEILKKKHIQNNVELIFPLINDLSIVNRAYSHYDIDYSTYLKNVNNILKSLKELIQNFILGFEIDMSTKSNKFYLNIIKRKDFENQAIFNFQISIRYTQFYQTLFELLSNYKEVLNFYSNDDKYKIPLIETELLKFVLKLLYLSFENNDENFSLILIFDSELLIKIFIQFDKEFHLFLKILSYNFFKKIDSVNFSIIENKYFSNLMNNLILSIDKEPDINFQIKWLKRIIKILEKNIKYINNSSSYLINTFQYVFLIIKNLNVKLFQSNDEERDSIYIPIQDQIDSEDFEDKDEFEKEVIRKDIRDNKNNILAFIKFFKECSKKCLQKNTNEDLILSLFDGYLNLLNMIIFNGLYCLNIFEYYFSPEVELFEKIIKNPNDNDISSKLELHLTRYIQLITFYPNFQIGKESDDIHQKMYLSNSEFYHKFHEIYQSKYTFNQIQNMLCNPNFIINNVYKNYHNENFKNEINYNSFPKKDETIDFINLKYNDIFESYQAKTIKNLYQNLDFLLIIIKRFDKFIDKELITKSSNCQKLITIFNYYEHCIIRPLFYTINFLNEENFILIEKITSKELFKIFEVAINFYKYTIILYKKTSSIKEEYIEISKKFSELDLEVFSKIPLNIEMSSLFIKKLKSHIWDFKCEERKYYEFKKIISDLKESIIAIISISDINESSKELDISKEIKNLPNENFERIKLIYNKYNKKKEKTFDNDLSLIKALDYSVGNSKGRKIIIQYIKNKFTNILTYYDIIHLENCDIKISFRKDYKLQTIDISKYRYQNSYCIYYMNIILNNDSKACQNYISSSFSYDSTKNFIISVIKNFIFGNFLYQISKLNELDNTLEYKVNCRSNLSFELATQYLKLLQNLCEGHNKEFQTVMFEINFLSSEDLKTNFDKNYKDFVARHSQLILYHKNRPKEKNESLLNFKKSQSDVVKTFKPVYSKSLSLTGITSKLGKENYDVSKEFPNEEEIDSDQEDIDYIITTFKKKKKVYDRDDNYLNANTQESEIKNEKFTQILPFKPLSFPNFIFLSMRIIFNNIKFNTNRNNEEIIEIYQKFNDLIVEIIQGTHSKNLDNFYRKLDDVILYDQKKKIMHFDNFIYFQFINLVYEIKEILYDFNIFESNSMINIKYNLFFILTNILNGENLNLETVKLFSKILDPKKLIELISKYLIIIYLKYNEKYQINDENFREKYLSLNLDMTIINRLHNEFKHNYDIFSDYIYRLSAQIYLYIKILGEKFDIIEANSILNLNNKDNQKVMDDLEENEKNKSSDFKKVHHSNESNHSQFPKNDLTEQKLVSIESLGCVNSFFKEMIKSCEFLIPFEDEDKVDEFDWECFDFIQDGSDDEDDDLISGINEDDKVEDISLIKDENASNDKTNENQENKPKEEQTLKKIYFIVDPKVYLISETNISYFFENADRSSSTNKLKYLLVSLEDFYTDLKYKLKLQEGNENMKILFKINYENVDYANLIFSMTIVLILLVFLNEESLNSWYLIVSVILLESIQVCMNLIFLLIFYHSKYNFYITKEKRKYNQVQLTNWEMLEIYLFKSFLFNDEVYLLILNVIFGILVILKPSFTMLFILQLLTIIKFLPTIKQIAEAFKIRISQLIMMVGFLFILIYFYSNISFFFYSKEFVMNSDSGFDENLCQSLFECTISLFNYGVRSNGGIGDILVIRSKNSSMYYPRLILDLIFYITVILLLLNMINGVIVSTFSQIREDSTEKLEDMKNKCYICSINRRHFEKYQISFDKHTTTDHNYITYIQYMIYLKLSNEKDMDSDQSYINSCIKNKDIGCFPIMRALSIKEEITENDN